MPYDALLGVTGPADSPGNSVEASAITADADGTKGYVYVGTYRSGVADCRINGAFDRTTGDEVLSFEIWEATDAAGTSAARIAASADQTSNHMADTDETGTVTLGRAPTQVGFMTGSGGWVKARFEVGASTTPSAAGVSVNLRMLPDAFRQSGV